MDISSLRERGNVSAFSVTELNVYIKRLLDGDRTLSSVTVKGEISNFKCHSSGHLYFSLKDSEGQVKAVMFRSDAARLKFAVESGMRVVVHGSVSAYTRDGAYQIYVSSMQPDGIGALYLAYEQLKEKLYAEGLFDESHKRCVPWIPEKIGVITSPTGAAVHDIINVTGRRFPSAKVYLYPVLVQGDGAEEQLVRAVDYFDRSGLVDVVIIGRGGGSIEDLWAFNSEALARRIYDARVPIISAVGHETDFTICDFVSDLRAPTPSAAAELAVPDSKELALRIDSYVEMMCTGLKHTSERARERLEQLESRCCEEKYLEYIFSKREDVRQISDDAMRKISEFTQNLRHGLALKCEKLTALNPLSVLSRGYSVVTKDGIGVRSANELTGGDRINIRFADGCADAVIE